MTDHQYGPPSAPYPAPVYYVAPPTYYLPPTNGMGIAALVLGIIGLVFSFVPVISVVVLPLAAFFMPVIVLIALPLVAVGTLLGAAGVNRARNVPGMATGSAIAGLACSLVGLAICVILLFAAAATGW